MKTINSLDNSLIKKLKKLQQNKYRQMYQEFLIEGFHLVSEAIKSENLLMILIDDAENLAQFSDFSNVIVVTPQILKHLSMTISNQGVIGLCKFKQEQELAQQSRVVLLDRIQDPNNLGAIIRSCVAFNVDTIYLSLGSVDLYNEKVIRTSQGALFYINIVRVPLENIIPILKNDNFKIYGTLFKESVIELKDVRFAPKHALIFGNEGQGVSADLNHLIDENFYLKISRNVESLNVAHCLSISLYEISQK